MEDFESSEDEDVLALCKELGIKIPAKKKKINITNKENLENLDINNLPIVILSDNTNISESSLVQLVPVEESINIPQPIASPFLLANGGAEQDKEVDQNEKIEQNKEFEQNEEIEQNKEVEQNEVEQNEEVEQTDDTEHGDLSSGRKRCSKGCPDKKNWAKNNSKKLRMEGKEYLGYRRDSNGPRFKVLHDTMRPARSIGPRCTSNFCKKSKLRGCDSIPEEERNLLFSNYWNNMTWEQRKQFVISNVQVCPKKQTKSKESTSRRGETKEYFLETSNGRVQVCKHTFLNTFGIKEWTVRYWLSSSELGMAKKPQLSHKVLEGHSKKDEIAFLKYFLNSLPRIPSHYCRANSSREYLEPIIENKNHLYKIYCDKCISLNKEPLSRWSFDNIFKEKNLSLFQPKKDQCDTCCAFKAGNLSEDDYHNHITRKDAAREEKKKDKDLALAGEVHVFTHDLQSVKLCPMLQASALYYKTKLCVHNFTMFNLATKDVHCYWFDEYNAGLVASVFASCVIDCLKKTLSKKSIPVVLFSDGCTSQNRNVVLANALLDLAMDYKIVITQKFLEKGHTQMECDASHSAIECKLKNKEIYLPSQYAAISKEARPKQPFIVNFLSYDFFHDYSNKNDFFYYSIRPGRVANDPTVTDLRVLEYNPNGIIRYKLRFEDEYKDLPRRSKNNRVRPGPRPKLYNSYQKINESKWKHLQELKSVIPPDCHSFYDNLLH